jgi:hypothetical protein
MHASEGANVFGCDENPTTALADGLAHHATEEETAKCPCCIRHAGRRNRIAAWVIFVQPNRSISERR